MTPEQCIQRLERRLGDRWVVMKRGLYYRPNAKGYTYNLSEAWILTEEEADKHTYPYDEPVTKHRAPSPDFLHSIDALRPVLATMTAEEKKKLHGILFHLWVDSACEGKKTKRELDDAAECAYWILTLDPQQLAFAIAEAIGEEKDL